MTLSMLSLDIDLRELRRRAAVQGLAGDDGRALHHGLCETFGKGVVQPFRLMPGRRGSRLGTLYAYTSQHEDELRQALRDTAPPEWASLLSGASLRCKTMPERWLEGRRLAFDVRVRPVRRLLRPLPARDGQPSFRKGAEIDAFLIDTLRHASTDSPTTGTGARESAYRAWLQERLAGARLVDDRTRMVRFERSRTLRAGRTSEAPDIVFHGELVIIDSAIFQDRLARGIGRHTAYGFGMLLLRPAGR